MTTPTSDSARETAYERGARHSQEGRAAGSGGGGAGFLQRNIGPLPLWVWLGLVLFAAIGYYVWSKHQAANSTSSSSDTSTGTDTTDSSLIPQFVNQVYTNQSPPSSPGETGSTSTGTGGNSSTTNSTPGAGKAGPSNKDYTAITASQATTLLSSKNTFNPSGKKSQRPFYWNGSAYVPATSIVKGYQYYAGPLEESEILKSNKK